MPIAKRAFLAIPQHRYILPRYNKEDCSQRQARRAPQLWRGQLVWIIGPPGLSVSHPVELTHLQEPTMVTHGLYQWMDTFLQTRGQIYHGHSVGISDSSSLQPTETRQPKEMCFSYFTGTDIQKLLRVTQDFSIKV